MHIADDLGNVIFDNSFGVEVGKGALSYYGIPTTNTSFDGIVGNYGFNCLNNTALGVYQKASSASGKYSNNNKLTYKSSPYERYGQKFAFCLFTPGYYHVRLCGSAGIGNPYYYQADLIIYVSNSGTNNLLQYVVPLNRYTYLSELRSIKSVQSAVNLYNSVGGAYPVLQLDCWYASNAYLFTQVCGNMNIYTPDSFITSQPGIPYYNPFSAVVNVDGSVSADVQLQTGVLPLGSYFQGTENRNSTENFNICTSYFNAAASVLWATDTSNNWQAYTDYRYAQMSSSSVLCIVPGTGGCGGELFAADYAATQEELQCQPRFVEHPSQKETLDGNVPKVVFPKYRDRETTYTFGKSTRNPGTYNIREFIGLDGGMGGSGLIPGQNGTIMYPDAVWSPPVFTDSGNLGNWHSYAPVSLRQQMKPNSPGVAYTGANYMITADDTAAPAVEPGSCEHTVDSWSHQEEARRVKYGDRTGFQKSSFPYGGRRSHNYFVQVLYNRNELPNQNANFLPTYAGQDGMAYFHKRNDRLRCGYNAEGRFAGSMYIVDYQLRRKTLDPDVFKCVDVISDSPMGKTVVKDVVPRFFPSDYCWSPAENMIQIKYLGTQMATPLFYF